MCDSVLPMKLIPQLLATLLTVSAAAQSFTASDLAAPGHEAVQCDVKSGRAGGRAAVQLVPQGNAAQQMLRLNGVNFRFGTIEFELFATAASRFIGLAYHVESEKSYEAVYFRPFRFRDPDPVGRRHAVQYISHPDHPWNRLRSEFPDVYESGCPVDPEKWIKVRIDVRPGLTRVFADDLDQPVITIDRPFERAGSGVALWTGVATRGWFANVKVNGSDDVARPGPDAPGGKPTGTFAIPAATGSPVDLLDAVDPRRHALVGQWAKTATGLEVQPTPFAQIVIPQEFPDSYDLDLSFTRRGNAESVTVFLPVGPKGVAVQFAAQGKHDGIGLINGTASWMGPATRPTSLESGKRTNASIRVRQQGESVRISQYVAGEPHVSWTGPVNALSLYQAFKIPSGKAGLGAFNNNTVFHTVTLKPVR